MRWQKAAGKVSWPTYNSRIVFQADQWFISLLVDIHTQATFILLLNLISTDLKYISHVCPPNSPQPVRKRSSVEVQISCGSLSLTWINQSIQSQFPNGLGPCWMPNLSFIDTLKPLLRLLSHWEPGTPMILHFQRLICTWNIHSGHVKTHVDSRNCYCVHHMFSVMFVKRHLEMKCFRTGDDSMHW